MKNSFSYIILFLSLSSLFSCKITTKTTQKVTNSYTTSDIEQYIQKRFLKASDSLKIGNDLFIIDGVPCSKEDLNTIDKKDIRSIYFININKNPIRCTRPKYDLLPIILTSKVRQKRKVKKESIAWIKERYFDRQYTIHNKPLIIFNTKPLTTHTAFQILQTLKVGHIDFIQKYEEPQVINGFEQISKNGVVEIFTK